MSTTERLNIPNTINWLNSMELRDIARELGFLSSENEALRSDAQTYQHAREALALENSELATQLATLRAQVEALKKGWRELGLERCEFDDECDFCNEPEGGTFTRLIHNAEDVTEADFYICVNCLHSAIKRHPTPSPLTRPVYLVATGEVHEGQETYTRHDAPVPLADQEELFTRLPAPLTRPAVPEGWKHDCAALLSNDVELWIDACPHCGKPRPALAAAPQPETHADCPACKGSEFKGFKRGLRCTSCDGTGQAPQPEAQPTEAAQKGGA